MKNKIEDLRNELFETITMIKNGEIDLDKAKAITDVAQVLVNSAKVEVDFIKAVDGIATGSGFIPLEQNKALNEGK